MRKLKPTKSVCKFLNNLNVQKTFNQIWKQILSLLKTPNLPDSIKIGEYNGHNILRNNIGEYRIIYYFDQEYLYIMLIGKRNDSDIYKKTDRKIK